MTDENDAAMTSNIARWLAEEATRKRAVAQLRAPNKQALFDALARAGLTHVFVAFDGCGDSGQIEHVAARAGDAEATLPDETIEIAVARHGADVELKAMSVAEAIETLAYDALEETHAGWEINDGAYGEFVFDVGARTIVLDYNERYTGAEHSSHEF